MSVNDVWMLIVQGTVSGQRHIHTLHFRELVAAVSGTPLITSWSGAPMTAYRALFATYDNPCQLLRAQKVCGNVPLPVPDDVAPVLASQAGTKAVASDNMMPSYVAALVTERGTLAGRSRSGRFFIGGLFEADVNGNSLEAAYVTKLTAYVDALKTAFVTPVAPDWRLVTFSRLLSTNDPDADPPRVALDCTGSSTPVGNLLVSTRPTTMRSRKLGHGI